MNIITVNCCTFIIIMVDLFPVAFLNWWVFFACSVIEAGKEFQVAVKLLNSLHKLPNRHPIGFV